MKRLIIFIVFASFMMAGCYDNVVFKDAKIPTVMGIEPKAEGFHSTFVIHTPIGTSQGIQEAVTEVISSEGKNIAELFANVEDKASGGLDLSKLYVSVLSEEYAKTNFEEFINRLTFAQRTSSSGQIIFMNGKSSDALAIRDEKVPLVDDYVSELIRSGISQNFIPDTNVAKVHRIMMDEGQDNIIPVFELSKQKDLWRTAGVSLMNGATYTGEKLNQVKTELLMAFMGDAGESYWEINSGELEGDGILIQDVRLDKDIGQVNEDGLLEVDLKLELGILYRSFNKETIAALSGDFEKQEDMLSKIYTDIAEETFADLNMANCDALGIGRDLIAYHPEKWAELASKDYYQNVVVKPEVKIKILKSN